MCCGGRAQRAEARDGGTDQPFMLAAGLQVSYEMLNRLVPAVRGVRPRRLAFEVAAEHDGRMSAAGYESWFVSARDPGSPRALWIRHTRHRSRNGRESAALWCTVVDRDLGQRPVVVKQVFGAFPPEAAAGPGRFRGDAAMGERSARWDLAITGGQPPLRPLRPALLYRAPLPRTKVEASVPDGLVTGTLEVDGHMVGVSGWRGTAGHNWGSEHADSWVWVHAAGFGSAPQGWLDLVIARIRIGRARSPWAAMGALSLGGEPMPLGGLGRRPSVEAHPGWLAAAVPSPGARLELRVTSGDDEAVAVAYADPPGGTRTVRHAALAVVELTWHRRGDRELTTSSSGGVYEYGTRQVMGGIVAQSLPAG